MIKMKKLIVTTILILVLLLIVMLSGCEPAGGSKGYQYLGTSRRIIIVCDANGNYTTTVIVREFGKSLAVCGSYAVIVRGKIDVGKRWFYVWLNTEKEKLRVRNGSVMAEHHVLMHYGPDPDGAFKSR